MIKPLFLTLAIMADALSVTLAQDISKESTTWSEWHPAWQNANGVVVSYERDRLYLEGDVPVVAVMEIEVQNISKTPMRIGVYVTNKISGENSAQEILTIPPSETRGTWYRKELIGKVVGDNFVVTEGVKLRWYTIAFDPPNLRFIQDF